MFAVRWFRVNVLGIHDLDEDDEASLLSWGSESTDLEELDDISDSDLPPLDEDPPPLDDDEWETETIGEEQCEAEVETDDASTVPPLPENVPEVQARARAKTLKLPVRPLADVRKKGKKAGTWNLHKVTYGKQNASIGTFKGNPRLVVYYPKGSINPTSAKKGKPVGGLGFYAAPRGIKPAEDVEFRYRVYFKPNWQPQQGGKLPGLFLTVPGGDIKGGSGGRHSDRHASLRVMWRRDAMAEAYVYSSAASDERLYLRQSDSHYNKRSGDSLWRGMTKFKKGAWNDVRMRVRLNTPGRSDGLLYLTVNGKKRTFSRMRWRTRSDVKISHIFFSTFYGGNTERWAAPAATHIYFKSFAVTKYK